MPIYEYECKKCGYRFDVFQSFSDPPVQTCRSDGCRGRVRRVLSPPTIIFKGSGFHVTDYRRNGKGSSSPSDKAEKIKEVVDSTSRDSSKTLNLDD